MRFRESKPLGINDFPKYLISAFGATLDDFEQALANRSALPDRL